MSKKNNCNSKCTANAVAAAHSHDTEGSRGTAIGVARTPLKTLQWLVFTVVASTLLLACSHRQPATDWTRTNSAMVSTSGKFTFGTELPLSPEGSFVLARILPEPSSFSGLHSEHKRHLQVLGFLPLTEGDLFGSESDSIRSDFTLSLTTGLQLADGRMMALESSQDITPGLYEIVMKQVEPVWYAPDTYFELRSLAVPPAGSSERFFKSAFGDAAVFLKYSQEGEHSDNSLLVIHSGPFLLAEEKNMRVTAPELLDEAYTGFEPGQMVLITN